MKRIGEACGGEGGSPPFFPSPTHLFLFFFRFARFNITFDNGRRISYHINCFYHCHVLIKKEKKICRQRWCWGTKYCSVSITSRLLLTIFVSMGGEGRRGKTIFFFLKKINLLTFISRAERKIFYLVCRHYVIQIHWEI